MIPVELPGPIRRHDPNAHTADAANVVQSGKKLAVLTNLNVSAPIKGFAETLFACCAADDPR